MIEWWRPSSVTGGRNRFERTDEAAHPAGQSADIRFFRLRFLAETLRPAARGRLLAQPSRVSSGRLSRSARQQNTGGKLSQRSLGRGAFYSEPLQNPAAPIRRMSLHISSSAIQMLKTKLSKIPCTSPIASG